MDKIKLFRILWRLNAIVIFIFCLLIIVIFVKERLLSKTTSYQSNLYLPDGEENNVKQEQWDLGELSKLNDTGLFIAPLRFEQTFSIGFSEEKHTSTVRNYLFVNTKTNSSSWLFENNDFVIETRKYIEKDGTLTSCSSQNKELVALYFTVLKQDTNQDNVIKRNDLMSIALTKPDGSERTEIETDITQVQSVDVTDNGQTLVLFYVKNDKTYVSTYSLATFKKLESIEIATNYNMEKE